MPASASGLIALTSTAAIWPVLVDRLQVNAVPSITLRLRPHEKVQSADYLERLTAVDD